MSSNNVITTASVKQNTDSIKRIHTVKYIVMTVSIFLIFPLLVYWVAQPNVSVHTVYTCINAQSATVVEPQATAVNPPNDCKQIVASDVTLTGIKHASSIAYQEMSGIAAPSDDGTDSVYDTSNPMYTPYSNPNDNAAICDALPVSYANPTKSSAARNTCIHHKTIRAGVVAVFVLMTIVGVFSFWMCRVTEGELLKNLDKDGNTPNLMDIFDKLEVYKGWRGIVGLIWGALLAAAVIWQVQVYENVYNSSTLENTYEVSMDNSNRLADAPGIGSTAFGSGVVKLMQIYLWFLFSLFTFKVIVNRYSIKNKLNEGNHIGIDVGPGIIVGLNSDKMEGVAVELAPHNPTSRPQLTMDPDKLTTHNALMRKSLQ